MANDNSENDVATTSREENAHQKLIGQANSNHHKSKTYSYPLDLGLPSVHGDNTPHSNYLILRSMNISNTDRDSFIKARNKLSTNARTSKYKFQDTIQLYMPPLVENIQQDYDTSQQSLIGQFGVEMSKAGITSIKDTADVAKKGGGAVVGTMIRGFLGHFNDSYQQQTGKIASAGVVGSYKGPSRRTQSLNFQFHPKSLPELQEVAAIIKILHLGALPTKQGLFADKEDKSEVKTNIEQGLIVYGVPPLWFLEEVTPLKDTVRYTPRFVFGPAGITSIRMNKTPDQYWKTFQGTAGDSASIEIEIQFTEMFALDQATYENDVISKGGYIGVQG